MWIKLWFIDVSELLVISHQSNAFSIKCFKIPIHGNFKKERNLLEDLEGWLARRLVIPQKLVQQLSRIPWDLVRVQALDVGKIVFGNHEHGHFEAQIIRRELLNKVLWYVFMLIYCLDVHMIDDSCFHAVGFGEGNDGLPLCKMWVDTNPSSLFHLINFFI